MLDFFQKSNSVTLDLGVFASNGVNPEMLPDADDGYV
jgi:hypothetical protein